MALRDIEFYFYLKEALKEKLRHPGLESFRLRKYNFDYDYIFQQARRVFPQKYHFAHTFLNGVSIAQLYDEKRTTELNQLNMEYAQDIVNGFGGLDETQANKQAIDQTLIEYENELTAPEEPDSFYQELSQNQLPKEAEKGGFEEPSQQKGQEEPSGTQRQQTPLRQPPHRVIVQKPEKPQYGMTKEEYAKYKEEHKEERAERARQLWEERKARRAVEETEEKEEDRKKRPLKGPGTKPSGGISPWDAKLSKWLKDKFANSRFGRWLSNSRLGQFLNKLGAPFRFVNNLLTKAGNWLGKVIGLTRLNTFLTGLGNSLRTLAGNALKSIGSQLLRLGSQLLRGALSGLSQLGANLLSRLAAQTAATAARSLVAGAGSAIAGIGIAGVAWIAIAALAIFTIWSLYDSNSECGKPGIVEAEKSTKKEGYSEEENIQYRILIRYIVKCKSAYADIEVKDNIPSGTQFIPGSTTPGILEENFYLLPPEGTLDGNTITWRLNRIPPNAPVFLVFSVKPVRNNIWIPNQATVGYKTYTTGLFGIGSTPTGSYSDASGILPGSIPPAPANWTEVKALIVGAFNKHPELIDRYKEASMQTGVPWQLLAGIHFVEKGGGPEPDTSLVSGRIIGETEPDINPAKCASGRAGPGIPIPIGGGCGFSSQTDSMIYAAKHLVEKINKIPSTFQEAVTALSRYNGGGNANCGEGLPYSPCPPAFDGEDDPYAMADFDEVHMSSKMYLIFCPDGVRCSSPRIFGRPGVMGVVRTLIEEGI